MKFLAGIRPLHRLQGLVLFFFAWLLARNAWYGDDVFISMCVIDNFVGGYGLVWNVGERVQVFTHPLWLLLLTPLYAVLRDPYQTIYWLSFVVSLAALYLLVTKFTHSYQSLAGALLLVAGAAAGDPALQPRRL
jgi:arabinofuranosyltransferase